MVKGNKEHIILVTGLLFLFPWRRFTCCVCVRACVLSAAQSLAVDNRSVLSVMIIK